MAKAKKTIQNETVTEVTIDQVLNEIKTTSGKVRYLFGLGQTRAQIAKTLNIRYQHVRNVLVTPLKTVKE